MDASRCDGSDAEAGSEVSLAGAGGPSSTTLGASLKRCRRFDLGSDRGLGVPIEPLNGLAGAEPAARIRSSPPESASAGTQIALGRITGFPHQPVRRIRRPITMAATPPFSPNQAEMVTRVEMHFLQCPHSVARHVRCDYRSHERVWFA